MYLIKYLLSHGCPRTQGTTKIPDAYKKRLHRKTGVNTVSILSFTFDEITNNEESEAKEPYFTKITEQ